MTPTRKITAAGVAGAAAIILAWVLELATSVELPAQVAAAVTTLLTFVTGYLVPEVDHHVDEDVNPPHGENPELIDEGDVR